MKVRALGAAASLVAWGSVCFLTGLSLAKAPDALDAKPKVELLLSTGKTIIGQPISYPTSAPAKITAAMITMQPGQTTGWHKHDVPLFAYILDGELTVDYGTHGKRVYKKGDSFMEAIEAPHDGTSIGPAPAKILAVFVGAEGIKNTEKLAAPSQ